MEKKNYRKRPVIISAIKLVNLTEECLKAVGDFLGEHATYPDCKIGGVDPSPTKEFVIRTLEGDMRANVGDYIIRGIKGEFYPCKPDIFESLYDEVTE